MQKNSESEDSYNSVRIDVHDLHEVETWCEALECAPDELIRAVDEVGNVVDVVRDYLNEKLNRNTYKYWFIVGSSRVTCGITDNLEKTEKELKESGEYSFFGGSRCYWKYGYIEQVGKKTTAKRAEEWESNNCRKAGKKI